MHEVNFNENTNIEKNIKLINKKKNSGIKIVIPSIITTVSVFTLFELVPITTILEKGLIAIGSALLGTGVYMIVDSIDEFISNFKKEKPDTDIKDIIVRSLKQPTCISAKEKDKAIDIEIEKELGVEIVGDTKVKIAIEEDEDAWDILDDDYDDEIDKEIDNNVKEDFIKDEK